MLETFRITGTHGRSIGAYRFADPSKIRAGVLAGRKVFSKEFKNALLARSDSKCDVCLAKYESRYLQVDHRVPYEVGGEGVGEIALRDFQLICGSCNRAKSWSCEHCTNWTEKLDPKVCGKCYWASPESYKHIAMRPIRRLELVWSEGEVADFDWLSKVAKKRGQPLPDFIKALLRERQA